jgi:putative N6-adenine-specific DNA methylase
LKVDLFLPCAQGVEALLADECARLTAAPVRAQRGGVSVRGDERTAMQLNLESRLAQRVLWPLAHGTYHNEVDLYDLARSVDWTRWITPRQTLRVDTTAHRSPLRSLNFATLRVKDGIVDRLRDRTGERPSIDTREPDVRAWLFLEARDATLYLDLSGEPLFKRGWRASRDDQGDAPLKENLAAGLLALSGWTPDRPLVDPFCGSGTIAIEAASIAHGVAPGLSRSFGFERLIDHDAALWDALRDDAARRAQAGSTDCPALIAASDIDAAAVDRARRNLERAGLPADSVRWSVGDFARLTPPFDTPGLIVANPPYGERIEAHGTGLPGDDHDTAMRAVGDALRSRWSGWQVWLLSSDPALPRQLGMKERRRTPLFNGAIECRLFGFEVFAKAPTQPDSPSRPETQARQAE